MPKNIVVIDDDKSESCSEDLSMPTDEKSLERVSLSAENLLKAATSARGGKNSSPLSCTRTEKAVTRVVNIASPAHDTSSSRPSTTTATVAATTAPRFVLMRLLNFQSPVARCAKGLGLGSLLAGLAFSFLCCGMVWFSFFSEPTKNLSLLELSVLVICKDALCFGLNTHIYFVGLFVWQCKCLLS